MSFKRDFRASNFGGSYATLWVGYVATFGLAAQSVSLNWKNYEINVLADNSLFYNL